MTVKLGTARVSTYNQRCCTSPYANAPNTGRPSTTPPDNNRTIRSFKQWSHREARWAKMPLSVCLTVPAANVERPPSHKHNPTRNSKKLGPLSLVKPRAPPPPPPPSTTPQLFLAINSSCGSLQAHALGLALRLQLGSPTTRQAGYTSLSGCRAHGGVRSLAVAGSHFHRWAAGGAFSLWWQNAKRRRPLALQISLGAGS